MGFFVEGDCDRIVFADCEARRCFDDAGSGYWNADGFCVERAGHVHVVGDVVVDEHEAATAEQGLDVADIPGDEVVHSDDFVVALQQQLTEVRPDEPGAARH